MLSPHFTYTIFDFETTGLDPLHDAPIQIGMIQFDHQFRILNHFQSYIRPPSDITSLKSLVGFITGIDITTLQTAPTMDELLPTIATFFDDHTVVIGQNISFDLAFLSQSLSTIPHHSTIDTLDLAKMLVHYLPSYSLEVIHTTLMKQSDYRSLVDCIFCTTPIKPHDAMSDTKMTRAVFRYLLQRIDSLIWLYPIATTLLSKSTGRRQIIGRQSPQNPTKDELDDDLFVYNPSPRATTTSLPSLSTPAHTQTTITTPSPLIWSDFPSLTKRYIGDMDRTQVLWLISTTSPTIIAFSNKAKLDIVKAELTKQGIKWIGFFRPTQTFDDAMLQRVVHQSQLQVFETNWIMKYLSHHDKGLWLIDHNTPWDYMIYSVIKWSRPLDRSSLILTTHAGLYSMESDEYRDYHIHFWDNEWRYHTYLRYATKPFDYNVILSQVEQLIYKYTLLCDDDALIEITALYHRLQMVVGIMTIEIDHIITTLSTNEIGRYDLWCPATHPHMTKTMNMLPKMEYYLMHLQSFLPHEDFASLQVVLARWVEILGGVCILEKRTYNQAYHYVMYTSQNFIDYSEFLWLWSDRSLSFFSNKNMGSDGKILSDTVREWYPTLTLLPRPTSVMLTSIATIHDHNDLLLRTFFLTNSKTKAKAIFDFGMHKGRNHNSKLIVENITGGSGKLISQTTTTKEYTLVGGVDFYFQCKAAQVDIQHIVIVGHLWLLHDQIVRDIQRRS